MKQYELWWAKLPAPVGRRPVLLLTRDSAYSYLNKYVVAEVTTTVRGIVEEMTLGRAAGLPRRCAACFDNVRTIPKSALVRRIGQVAPSRYQEVKRALGYALDWEN